MPEPPVWPGRSAKISRNLGYEAGIKNKGRDRVVALHGVCNMNSGKKIIIIAGPNGAGKTTFALEYLPHEANCPVFRQRRPDSGGAIPFQPGVAAIRAGRLMLQEISNHAKKGESLSLKRRLRVEGM